MATEACCADHFYQALAHFAAKSSGAALEVIHAVDPAALDKALDAKIAELSKEHINGSSVKGV